MLWILILFKLTRLKTRDLCALNRLLEFCGFSEPYHFITLIMNISDRRVFRQLLLVVGLHSPPPPTPMVHTTKEKLMHGWNRLGYLPKLRLSSPKMLNFISLQPNPSSIFLISSCCQSKTFYFGVKNRLLIFCSVILTDAVPGIGSESFSRPMKFRIRVDPGEAILDTADRKSFQGRNHCIANPS